MHPDKIKELQEELAHEDAQIHERKRFRSWKERTQDAFRQIQQLKKEDPNLSFMEAAGKVGLIKNDERRETN